MSEKRVLLYEVGRVNEVAYDPGDLGGTITIVFDTSAEAYVAIRIDQEGLLSLEATLAKLRERMRQSHGSQ